MGRTLQLLVKRSGGKFSPHLIHFLIMKFFAIIAFVGYTQAFLVRREAAPEADADADAGYGYGAVSPAAVSAPVCNSVPEKVGTPNMMRLLTPPSLNIVKRLSPPSASRPAP